MIEFFNKISNGGVVILTPDMCSELDALLSKTIAGEVAKYASAVRDNKRTKEIYTYKEVRDIFHINDGTIRNWAASGLLKVVQIGGRRYISAKSINLLIS